MSDSGYWSWVTEYYSSVKSEVIKEGNIVSVLEEADIQGDPGGNIKYLGSDIIGHCERKNVSMNMCLILNGY
jgi:hypothetical protein